MFHNWTHVWVHSSYPEEKQDPHHGFDIKSIFSFMSKNRSNNFWFSVSWREKRQRIRQTRNKYIAPTLSRMSSVRVNFSGSKSFRIHRAFKTFFLIKICCCMCFQLIHASKNSVLGKMRGKFSLQLSSHRLLSLIESRCDPVWKWALKQKTAGNLRLGARDW